MDFPKLVSFLFHQLSNGRDSAFNDLMLSKQTVQGVDLSTWEASDTCVSCNEVWTMPSSAQKGLRSDQFLWEGTVEGVAREGEFVDMEGVTTARRMISSNK